MADELKRVGLVFKADGTVDFNKSLKEVNASVQENRTAFALVKSQWDENTSSMEKLRATQKYLADQTKDYSDKVIMLQRQLDELESAENRDEKAIQSKRSQLNQAKTSLNNYKKGLEEVEEKLKGGAARTEDYQKKLESFGNKAKDAGDKISGVSTAAAGLIGAVAATVPATEEYRKIMGSLEVSSEKAGYSADQTAESYRTLYGVLSDDQTAATTTANLQALGLSQQDLTTMINGTIGAWATYGDSIPIDGLAEAINETVKTGVVTGTFADMLNWAGTSEDAFNEKLAACSSESERANLIMQEMANQGLTQAGEKWQENNKNLVEGNKATADLQAATAEMAETISPIITQVTQIVAGLVEKFNALPPGAQQVILGFIMLVAAASPLITGIGNISLGVKALMPLFSGLWGLMKANTIGIVVTVIGLLVAALVKAYEKVDWFRDIVDTAFEAIGDAADWLKDKLNSLFSFDWVSDIPVIGDIANFISGSSKKKSRSLMSAPEMPVKWFASGGILNRPTIFGRNGDQMLGGGEAGAEAVLPIDLLRRYIREENQVNNASLAALIQAALEEMSLVAENNIFVGDKKLDTVVTKMVLKKISSQVSSKKAAKGK